MTPNLDKLLSIGGHSLATPHSTTSRPCCETTFPTNLEGLYSHKNGFYAFESALHIFPSNSIPTELSLSEWNDPSTWIMEYKLHEELHGICFAEDVFGVQFLTCPEGIFTFNPETTEREKIATDVEHWAELILGDYAVMTGYSLARDWQAKHGGLPAGSRLVPKIPFVLGGAFSVDNVFACERRQSMRIRAHLANQIRSFPDGTVIQWQITP